ncbi:aldose 1-epimerase [Pseudoalteromonas prydzensis ACAM 620]|uniref:Aldose 1-epimerase n=2 Tax=Pseudoalteromonas TaxID=53246 RepID=A0ABR9FKR1_9GAMM|nr:aldose 1-epimerase [Pseudoalteromonas prydzensis ACAM 620]MBE0457382.1 galactose mutarotase [Pseudoalteromonas prydzensis]|eukprot:TRINITY_DN4758_c0_g8_i1.p1 TRINITY_DN4758_c0_g8~~TRINITY_DN4758_c0_g8_i1.p1  ORF type:complete len:404 (-),score=97.59 TRINITY_DN4758_c0_g8_i1:466-1677(-)
MSLQCVTQRLTAVHQSSASIKKFSRGIFAVAVSFSIALTPACAHQGDNMSNSPSALLHAYGKLADQTPINQVTLTNSNGVSVDVINYGGIITRIETPDSNGNMGNIVLGLDNLEDYTNATTYFGAIIGRFGNRIANGKFSLNGTDYQLATNDGDNHLHGGVQGFDKKVWTMVPFSTENSAGVTLSLVSPDGDQGYPGELTTQVTYTLTNKNTLDMQFVAKTNKPTIINMTQHSYFNLAGKGDILDHQMQINSNAITPVDGGLIPTGELMQVAGTPFDFRNPKAIGKDINIDDEQLKLGKGYDHNFVLKNKPNHDLIEAANVYEPSSGRTLTVYTEEPAVQFYSGNFLDGSSKQASGLVHKLRSGFCLEPQHFPDAPNQPTFPSTTLLPGEVYSTRIVYEFGTK